MLSPFDLLITNGTIVDGTGRPGYQADLAITGAHITKIGNIDPSERATAKQTIDATGCIVSPGYIDVHTHSELAVLRNPDTTDKLLQGVTTDVLGNCGYALFPVVPETQAVARDMLANLWGPIGERELFADLDGYFNRLEEQGLAYNVVQQATAAMTRIAVLGGDRRAPTETEQKQMNRLLETMLEQGACGMSSGLIYAPGCYADVMELSALSSVVARHGKMVSSHIRGEGDTLELALKEAVDTARNSGVSFQISHLKAVGPRQWGTIGRWLDWLDSQVADGVRLHFDSYPYDAGSTTICALLPSQYLEGGMDRTVERLRNPQTRREIVAKMQEHGPLFEQVGGERVLLTAFRNPARQDLVGKTIADLAREWSVEPADVVCQLIEQERGMVTIILYHMREDDVETVFQHPRQMVGSDGIPSAEGKPHPRQFATYVRVLEEFVRRKRLCTLETAIRKMTALPAEKVGLTDRGRLVAGLAADVTVFDFAGVHDSTTYQNPFAPIEGIRHVIVNGQLAVHDGQATKNRAGKPLRV